MPKEFGRTEQSLRNENDVAGTSNIDKDGFQTIAKKGTIPG